jgi:molybdenum cofactor biosynthesis enzyme MoaA
LFTKNRSREAPSFANINLLGRCNVDCYFCLGKDIPDLLAPHNQLTTHFLQWNNWLDFLITCQQHNIRKLYVTGQNTDSLQYRYLAELINYLHRYGFQVGLRTNGYLALKQMAAINQCDLSVGYSIHTLKPDINFQLMKHRRLPEWQTILEKTKRPRVQIVVTRHNASEVFDIIKWLSQFPHLRYVQVRRVSSDTRREELAPDALAYDTLLSQVQDLYPRESVLWGTASIYRIHGLPVCFWQTTATSINSFNYFTDGTISREYFIVEGYKKALQGAKCDTKV